MAFARFASPLNKMRVYADALVRGYCTEWDFPSPIAFYKLHLLHAQVAASDRGNRTPFSRDTQYPCIAP